MPDWRRGSKQSVQDLFTANVERSPDKPCFGVDGNEVTFGSLLQTATAWANSFVDRGIGPGDRVAAFVPNDPVSAYCWMACSMLGVIYVPINVALHGEFLRHQLQTVDPSLLIVHAGLLGRVGEVAGSVPGLRHISILGGQGDAPVPEDLRHVSLSPVDALAQGEHDQLRSPHTPRWDDPNTILFTSGTTGPSKGALMSQAYVIHIARTMARSFRVTPDTVWYQPSPLFHVNALLNVVWVPSLLGSTGYGEAKFSASRYWDQIRRYGATRVALLTFPLLLWNQPVRDDDGDNPVEYAAGTAIPTDLHVAFEQRFQLRILKQYALSEACALPITSSVEVPAPPGYSGRANPDFEVVLLDDNDDPAELGQAGEIAIRPKAPHTMFSAYYNNPEATAAAWRNGWFHTGDLAKVDEEGLFTFVDRKKDYIRHRGENISSAEVEGALQAHPDIEEVAVHAVPGELGEDDVKVCLVVRAGHELDFETFAKHCADTLPFYAVPRYYEILPALPRNQTGRVLKTELRARGVTPQTWDRPDATRRPLSGQG